jgi:hypothetical protein
MDLKLCLEFQAGGIEDRASYFSHVIYTEDKFIV